MKKRNRKIFLGNYNNADQKDSFGGAVYDPTGIACPLKSRDHKSPITILVVSVRDFISNMKE